MPHQKVYAQCENLCLEETYTKNQLDEKFSNVVVPDSSITSAKLTNNAVTSTKISNNAVTVGKIADNAVSNAKLATNSVSTEKIADNNVTESKISTEFKNKLAYKTDLPLLLGNAMHHTPTYESCGNGTKFTSNIFPVFTSNDDVNGYKIVGCIGSERYKAFDNNNNTSYRESTSVSIGMECPILIKPTKFYTSLYCERIPEYELAWVDGSMDGTNWEKICDLNKTEEEAVTEVNTNKYYKFFRISAKYYKTGYTYEHGIRTFNICEGYTFQNLDDQCDKLILSLGGLQNYVNYQKLSLKIPSDYVVRNLVTKINIDDLGDKVINKALQPNALVDLVYNGSEFV